MTIGEIVDWVFDSIRPGYLALVNSRCRDFTIVKDLPGIEAGIALCNFIEPDCPYHHGVFIPRETVEMEGAMWEKGRIYPVCTHASSYDYGISKMDS